MPGIEELWEDVGVANWLLAPASWFYGLGWRCYEAIYRLGLKRAKEPHRPVVCVGNLTVGGSGKSPLTIHIAEVLQELGYEVAISCSGYGSPASEMATLAPEGELSAKRWGDEPAMIRDALPNVPLIVGRNRVRAAELCGEHFPNAVLLMDDGFQHLPVKKHVAILLDDPARKNRFCMPAGPYRQPWKTGLGKGDLVLPGGGFDIGYQISDIRYREESAGEAGQQSKAVTPPPFTAFTGPPPQGEEGSAGGEAIQEPPPPHPPGVVGKGDDVSLSQSKIQNPKSKAVTPPPFTAFTGPPPQGEEGSAGVEAGDTDVEAIDECASPLRREDAPAQDEASDVAHQNASPLRGEVSERSELGGGDESRHPMQSGQDSLHLSPQRQETSELESHASAGATQVPPPPLPSPVKGERDRASESNPQSKIQNPKSKIANALCSIARPERFRRTLEEAGIQLQSFKALPDHADLSTGTIFDGLDPAIPLIVTAKDWVKLRENPEAERFDIRVAQYRVTIEPGEAFRSWLHGKLKDQVPKAV